MEETPEEILQRLARYRESVGGSKWAKWIALALGVAVALLVVIVVLVVHGSGGGHSPASAGGAKHDTTPGRGEAPSTLAADRPNGAVVADASGHYGQAPSNGTCARWTQRFVNHSDARVVRISFEPVGAMYTQGDKTKGDYRTWPAATPPAAQLNVSLEPSRAAVQQFMICTATAPPAPGTSLVITPPAILHWIWQDGISGSGKLHG